MGTLAGRYDPSKPIAPIEDGARSSKLAVWRTNMRIPHLDTQQFELVRLLFSIGLTVLVCVGSLLTIRYLIGSPLQLNARPAPRTPIAGHQRSGATKQKPDRQANPLKLKEARLLNPRTQTLSSRPIRGLDNEDAASRPLRAAGPLTYLGEGGLVAHCHAGTGEAAEVVAWAARRDQTAVALGW